MAPAQISVEYCNRMPVSCFMEMENQIPYEWIGHGSMG